MKEILLVAGYLVVGWTLATFVVYVPMRNVKESCDKFGRDINYAFVLFAWPVWIALACLFVPIILLYELSEKIAKRFAPAEGGGRE